MVIHSSRTNKFVCSNNVFEYSFRLKCKYLFILLSIESELFVFSFNTDDILEGSGVGFCGDMIDEDPPDPVNTLKSMTSLAPDLGVAPELELESLRSRSGAGVAPECMV